MNSALEVPETNPVAKQVYLKAFGARVPNPYSKEGIMLTRIRAIQIHRQMVSDLYRFGVKPTTDRQRLYLQIRLGCLLPQKRTRKIRRSIDAIDFLLAKVVI